ncbi:MULTISPECIES: T9SS type A sorting domain-containing protein [unclassified Polaribacter]|uniref:T9SS type A sorting domain-containing protein n=1 Tax=unclassified Polaribacter TaxID=196858 RepID=UPI001674D2DF|nr:MULTISPECIES: T9SS type A sorting domain-containing protein [unclassified Polaribacter]
MLTHETSGTTFYKNFNTSISLNLSNGSSNKTTKINYLNSKTAGLDPGFDIGMFNGVASDIRVYTQLIQEDQGIAFARQALPNTDLETMVIPVGVKAAANKEITFSANANNLPTDLKVFLEDKLTNTFTRLDETNSSLKITLSEALNGIGRFYLHTKTSSVLSTDNVVLTNISMYKINASTLRITGLSQGKTSVKLFNMLGKQVLNTSFTSNGMQDITLPTLATGVYIVQLETAQGNLNKKITLE